VADLDQNLWGSQNNILKIYIFNIICKAQISYPKALRAALGLLGLRAGPKDKATRV